MATEKKLALQTRDLLFERGLKGLENARRKMKAEKISYERLKSAVDFFMDSWQDVVHPALLSLSCEAVGGNPDATMDVAAAYVLLAGGADLHDDIIDESSLKDSKPTVYGKFGKELTLLAGDALLFRGLYALQEACVNLPNDKKESVLESTRHAFFGISSAEAKETGLRKKVDVAHDYLEMIKIKSAVSEASTKIGAIIGNGTDRQVKLMSDFGRNFGVLLTLRDEFIDILDYKELANRHRKECLPLPIQLALRMRKKEILPLLTKKPVTKKNTEKLFDLIINLKPNVELKAEMSIMVKTMNEKIAESELTNKNCLELLLNSMIEDL